MKALPRDQLLDLVVKGLILAAVLGTMASASKARTAFIPPVQKPDPHALRGGARDESPETRLALMEQSREAVDARIAMLERQMIEHALELRKLDRIIVGIQAVSAANTQANWIVGGGFVAQFLFSLMRYLKLHVPKLPRGDA